MSTSDGERVDLSIGETLQFEAAQGTGATDDEDAVICEGLVVDYKDTEVRLYKTDDLDPTKTYIADQQVDKTCNVYRQVDGIRKTIGYLTKDDNKPNILDPTEGNFGIDLDRYLFKTARKLPVGFLSNGNINTKTENENQNIFQTKDKESPYTQYSDLDFNENKFDLGLQVDAEGDADGTRVFRRINEYYMISQENHGEETVLRLRREDYDDRLNNNALSQAALVHVNRGIKQSDMWLNSLEIQLRKVENFMSWQKLRENNRERRNVKERNAKSKAILKEICNLQNKLSVIETILGSCGSC